MNIIACFGRLFCSQITRLAAGLLITLVLSFPAFCGEIHDAAETGDLAKVKTLLNKLPKLVSSKDSSGYTPLHLAAYHCHKDIIELLLANGADVNVKAKNGDTPLHSAMENSYKDVVELLLTHGADTNAKEKDGWTPLHMAVFYDHLILLRAKLADYTGVVELLLTHGADANARANNGWTPLYMASRFGLMDVYELLRQHGGHE
jgi:uncharacterized protein